MAFGWAFLKSNISEIVYRPGDLKAINLAHSSEPSAKTFLSKTLCFMLKISPWLAKETSCSTTTPPSHLEEIERSPLCLPFSKLVTCFKEGATDKIAFAIARAVPLGASFFWEWWVSEMSIS